MDGTWTCGDCRSINNAKQPCCYRCRVSRATGVMTEAVSIGTTSARPEVTVLGESIVEPGLDPPTTPNDASVRGTRLRRFAPVGVAVFAVVIGVMLGGWLLTPSLGSPKEGLLSWKVDRGPGFDPAAALTTVVQIEVEHPSCIPISPDPSWLAAPIISYTPWSVTITMRLNDTVVDTAKCHGTIKPSGGLPYIGGYLTGIFYPVQLREPLWGRLLFDGSYSPPAVRW